MSVLSEFLNILGFTSKSLLSEPLVSEFIPIHLTKISLYSYKTKRAFLCPKIFILNSIFGNQTLSITSLSLKNKQTVI